MGAAALAGDREAHRREVIGGLALVRGADGGEGGLEGRLVPGGGFEDGQQFADAGDRVAAFLGEVGLGALVRLEVGGEEEAHELRQVFERDHLFLHDAEDLGEAGVGDRSVDDLGLEQDRAGERGELGGGQVAERLGVDVRHLALVETGVGLVHRGDLELPDDLLNRQHFLAVGGRPAEQAEVVADGGGQVAALLVFFDEGALVALGHLARAVGLEDERDVGVLRRFDAEGLEELEVLRGVGEVVFAADHVRDPHLDVVDDVDEVEDRFAVGAEDDEVAVFDAGDLAADQVVQHHRRGVDLLVILLQVLVVGGGAGALEAEPPGAVLLIGAALGGELLELGLVESGALRLEVGAVVAADLGPLVPIHAQPAHRVEDHLQEGVGVALLVGVLDAEDELAARVTGVEPVEQGRAGASDMEEAGGAGGEADADLGHWDRERGRGWGRGW